MALLIEHDFLTSKSLDDCADIVQELIDSEGCTHSQAEMLKALVLEAKTSGDLRTRLMHYTFGGGFANAMCSYSYPQLLVDGYDTVCKFCGCDPSKECLGVLRDTSDDH